MNPRRCQEQLYSPTPFDSAIYIHSYTILLIILTFNIHACTPVFWKYLFEWILKFCMNFSFMRSFDKKNLSKDTLVKIVFMCVHSSKNRKGMNSSLQSLINLETCRIFYHSRLRELLNFTYECSLQYHTFIDRSPVYLFQLLATVAGS